jgi:threonine dehydratase
VIDLDTVARAHRMLPIGVRDTPQYWEPQVSSALGRDVAVKLECFNPVRSFKARGALTFLASVPDGTRVVCASAGNFGQGLAWAAQDRDVEVTVFAATTASPNKLDRMRELGAELEVVGEDYDAAKDAARAAAAQDPAAVWVEDGADDLVTVGAATVGLELADLDPDVVLVPVGNGALVIGVASWLARFAPRARVIGVCAAGAPAMLHSWQRGTVVSYPAIDTFAEGVGVRAPIPAAVATTRQLVDDMIAVDDDTILDAMRCLHDTIGVLVEPAAALGIAALLPDRAERIPGRRVATIITGANYTAAHREAIEHWA